jgi:HD superfamily phosphodiesterase
MAKSIKNISTNFKLIERRILKMLKNGLNPTLHYHGYPHTTEVIKNVKYIAEKEGITAEDIHLLKMAALFHDLGFLEAYSGHEEVGCRMAHEMLPTYGVNEADIAHICKMIMTTKVPQSPKTLLEKILCDADLLYLGTDNFIEIGNTLFMELVENGKLKTNKEWNDLQIIFLKKHYFHTNYCIENYEPRKLKNLKKVQMWVKNYDQNIGNQ